MKIRNVDFDFDLLRAADAARFECAAREMQCTAARIPRDSMAGVIKGTCAMIDSFLADVLGEDYDQRMGLDVENLRQLQKVYQEVLVAVTSAQQEIQTMNAAFTVANVDVKARADAAAKAAAANLPASSARDSAAEAIEPASVAEPLHFRSEPEMPAAPAQPAQPVPPVPFDQMNRAQRREYIKHLKGNK